MPLYEYACCACRSHVEVLVMGKETPKCPECGSRALKRIMSVPGIVSITDHHTNQRKNYGAKGFTVKGNDGTDVPLYNKYR